MKELIIILRREKAQDVKALLQDMGIDYVSKPVLGKGKEGGFGYSTRKGVFKSMVPKVLIMSWVEDALYNDVVSRVLRIAHTGHYGDGKIFVMGGLP